MKFTLDSIQHGIVYLLFYLSIGPFLLSCGGYHIDKSGDDLDRFPNRHSTVHGSIGVYPWIPKFDSSVAIGYTEKAIWKFGKKTAMAITYDGSTEGQALYGVPEMSKKNLVGTWFINPGGYLFDNHKDIWDNAYATYGQEIANYTMYRSGGATYEEAESSVDLANDYIKQYIYKMTKVVDEFPPKILAFNKVSVSGWWTTPTTNMDSPNPVWDEFIRNNYLVERIHSTGAYKAMPFEEMKMAVLNKFGEGSDNVKFPEQSMYSRSIQFNGICKDGEENCLCTPKTLQYEICEATSEVYPSEAWRRWSECILMNAYQLSRTGVQDCSDSGLGSVKRSEIQKFFDWLVNADEYPALNIWIAGYAQYRKYETERINSVVVVESSSDSQIILNLNLSNIVQNNYVNSQSPNSPISIYDEPISLFTKVPVHWTAVKVTQNGVSHIYKMHASEVRYEVYPNQGQIILENADLGDVDITYLEI